MEKKEKLTKSYKKAKDLTIKQQGFIEAYFNTFGNITSSCGAVKISRQTYYDWKNNCPEFKRIIESVDPREMLDDYVVRHFIVAVSKLDSTLIKEYMNKRAKSIRLWDEDKQEDSGTTIQVFINEEEKQ